ncbi:ABC transporter ATP-binding protein [Schinkia azotoformans]|uniref:ABC transporter ATP-binding protein n=1 Tax=Schinkia azotoformans TaxID=1454 RepID=UPI002E21DC6A|nr:ABC transporter ATP-binding protein [Schinkia azotoformans]
MLLQINKKVNIHGILSNIKTLYQLFIKKSLKVVVFIVIFKLLLSLIPLIQLEITKRLVNKIEIIFSDNSQELEGVLLLLTFQLLLFFLNTSITSLNKYNLFTLQLKTKYLIEKKYIEKSLTLPLIFFEQPKNYNLLQRASQGQGERLIAIIESSLTVFQNIITLFGYFLILSSLSWYLSLGIVLLIIPSVIVDNKIGHWQYSQNISQTTKDRQASYLSGLFQDKKSIKEIIIFMVGPYLKSKWSFIILNLMKEKTQLERKTILVQILIGTINNICILLALLLLIWFGLKGQLTIGYYVALSQALISSQGLIKNMSQKVSRIYSDSLFLSHLLEFLRYPEEIKEIKDSLPFPKLQTGISVKNLYFTYSDQSQLVLKNINFEIQKGQKVAIVGRNGSGKTTLIKCLLGLYQPTHGEIKFDNVDIKEIDKKSLRNNFSSLFQDFVCYQLTVNENIGFGDIHNNNHTDIVEASKISGANEFIEELPKKYNTELGRIFKQGQDLSYGQWQKLAISRASLKKAQIIILDEPTASLDPKSEIEIFNKFIEIAEDKTTIFISHRLSSCINADVILVLNNGELIEQGSHQELLNLNGEYAELYKLQSNLYEKGFATAYL